MKLVYLEWEDAHSASGWKSDQEVDEWLEGAHWFVRQVGWLLRETPKYVVLAGDFNPECDFRDAQYGNLQYVPKTWIRKRKDLSRYIK